MSEDEAPDVPSAKLPLSRRGTMLGLAGLGSCWGRALDHRHGPIWHVAAAGVGENP
ncbi:MAG: hypothetical protein U5K37_04945 [Natrialbaceae archaeon]|nr:hypothetical protein [Natrialbaceae archaeon]